MPTSQYSLLDEPWLPVSFTDGSVSSVGLREAFARSGEIAALADTAPPNVVALYRLLLVIFHRALMEDLGKWHDTDRADWYVSGLPVEIIHAYLEKWRDRFNLFDPAHPFMQVAALNEAEETRNKVKPWTQLDLASATGNTPVVFDHSLDDEPTPIHPATAVRTLLGFLQFTPGGLVKTVRDADKAGALVNTAAVLPVGGTLAQTLCLSLHPATVKGVVDLPAWERSPLSIVQLRGEPLPPSGPNDRYTRQSRAVLLRADEDGQVRWVRFAAGFALGEAPGVADPMASYRMGSTNFVRLTFTEGRACWRDLPALVPDLDGKSAQPAAVLNYAANLHEASSFEQVYQPLLVAGVASDQAKLLRWRSERVALPVALLADAARAQHLRTLIALAEAVFVDLRRLAGWTMAQTLPDSGSKDTYARARDVIEAGPLMATYFNAAEIALPALLSALARGDSANADLEWRAALRSAAHQGWARFLSTLGKSARAVQADAQAWPRFLHVLKEHLPQPNSAKTGDPT